MKKTRKNRSKNTLLIIASIIASFCAFILTLYISFLPNALNKNNYTKYYDENVIEETNYSYETLEMLVDRSLKYAYGHNFNLQIEVTTLDNKTVNAFSWQEITHMKDVQTLFKKGRLLCSITFIIFIGLLVYIYKKRKLIDKKVIKAILISYATLLLALIIISIELATNFFYHFIRFHEIFFDNYLFILDSTDILISLMPEEAFYNITLYSAIIFIILILIEMSGIYLLNKKIKRKK